MPKAKTAYLVVDGWGNTLGAFHTKREAETVKRQRAVELLRMEGGRRTLSNRLRVKKSAQNPKRKNPPKAVRVKNFTGTITRLKNGQVKITGRAKKR